jgi:hypothetical protein
MATPDMSMESAYNQLKAPTTLRKDMARKYLCIHTLFEIS